MSNTKMTRATWFLSFVAAVITVFPGICTSAETNTKFEVASLKPVRPDAPYRFSGGPGSATPDRAFWGRVRVRDLVATAHRVQPDRVSGPPWLDAEYSLDVRYTLGAGDAEFRHMVVELLIERFNIKTRTQLKTLKGYALNVAQGGVKFKAANSPETVPEVATSPAPPAPSKRDSLGFPVLKPGTSAEIALISQTTARMTFASVTMAAFVRSLNSALNGFHGGPPDVEIVDRTRLKGTYQFRFETPVPIAPALPGELELIQQYGGTAPEPGDPHAAARSISLALQKQLGLRLDPARVEVGFVVVEQMDRTPRQN